MFALGAGECRRPAGGTCCGNPDAGHDLLPAGLAGSLNLSETGMFGWSIGGAASAQAMHDAPRIKAAINMDGTFWGPVDQGGVNRPFLMLAGDDNTAQNDPRIAPFLAASTHLLDGPSPRFPDISFEP